MSTKVERIKIDGKRKMYSLNDIWRLCRKMWDDIKDEDNIAAAKATWLKRHGFSRNSIQTDCFFCEWASKQRDRSDPYGGRCNFCPGRAVSPSFDCCKDSYHYHGKPRKFEAKIKALDLKRIH